MVKAAKVFKRERLASIPYNHCYPRFAVLAYTCIVEALREPATTRTTEQLEDLLEVWHAMQGDPEMDLNFDLMKHVRNIHFKLHYFTADKKT